MMSRFFYSQRLADARHIAQTNLANRQNDVRLVIEEVSELAAEITNLLQRRVAKPEAVLLCDLDGKIIRCNVQSSELFLSDVRNQAIDELLQFDIDEIGTTWKSLVWSTPTMEKTVALAAIPYSGETFQAEVTMVRLADMPPNLPRVLFMIRRRDDSSDNRYSDVTERVNAALSRIQVTPADDPLSHVLL